MRYIPAAIFVVIVALPSSGRGQEVAAPRYTPPPPKEGYRYPDCYCTDTDGARVEIGDMACLRIGEKRILAQCDMSQNTPAWRPQREGCPIS